MLWLPLGMKLGEHAVMKRCPDVPSADQTPVGVCESIGLQHVGGLHVGCVTLPDPGTPLVVDPIKDALHIWPVCACPLSVHLLISSGGSCSKSLSQNPEPGVLDPLLGSDCAGQPAPGLSLYGGMKGQSLWSIPNVWRPKHLPYLSRAGDCSSVSS